MAQIENKNENLLKNELLIDEKKQKKSLYKNWKLYASTLGVLVIGTGAGVGIYYGVNANNGSTTAKISIDEIITAISNETYQATTEIGSLVASITDQITPEFIQKQLQGKIHDAFQVDKVDLANLKVMVDNDHELNETDLANATTTPLNATISFKYVEKDVVTNLAITVGKISLTKAIEFTTFQVVGQNETPINEEIMGQLIRWNQNLTENKENLIISDITRESATVSAAPESKIYQGSVALTYKYLSVQEGKDVVKNADLKIKMRTIDPYNTFITRIRDLLKKEFLEKKGIDVDDHPKNDPWHNLGITCPWNGNVKDKITKAKVGDIVEFKNFWIETNDEWNKIIGKVEGLTLKVEIVK